MQVSTEQKKKIKGYISIANKAGYLIIGADNLKSYNKKLYLLLADSNSGKNLLKILDRKNEIPQFVVDNLFEFTGIENCKIVGIRNLGLSNQIIKLIKEQ